jgi:murein L,D-transpeptidase YcbB/YkuD
VGLIALAFGCAMPQSARLATPPPGTHAVERLGPLGEALREQLAGADPQLAAFYEARRYRPLWIHGWGLKRDAQTVLQAVAHARNDGLDPEAYGVAGLPELLAQAQSRQPADLARAEIALSHAAAGYLSDLHKLQRGAEMIYADPAVVPVRPNRAAVLQAMGEAPNPADAVVTLGRMSPLYEQLRARLAAWRAHNGDAATEQLIRINLERARGLPTDAHARYILVDSAAQQLWLYKDGRVVDSMPVVVGKVSEPTPSMAGVIRYAVARPYWNVPPDLAQSGIAPKALRDPLYLQHHKMEALSDWTPQARVLQPSEVNWRAVVSGRQILRVRQLPGSDNMMGQVKFVFPNNLGVYLHDSPLRQYFTQTRRAESAGCVRLSDAPRLARWLIPEHLDELTRPGAPETRLELAEPIPVYIVYLTAAPDDRGLSVRPDIYKRDAALIARLAQRDAKG